MSTTPWGGRFGKDPDPRLVRFTESVSVDARLALFDIEQSIAHATMLGEVGILPKGDAAAIVAGLRGLAADVSQGRIEWKASLEDVHMNLETLLVERVGEVGKRLHTARSRNDQVATDLALFLRDFCGRAATAIDTLQRTLIDRARETIDVLMPGYTHLQRAQPVRLAHHLHAWVEMIERDRGRIVDAARRMDACPLGSGALAGTALPIDRARTAKALGFARPSANSMHSVSSRDGALEVLSAVAIGMTTLSRVSEDLVLWTTQEFGFAALDAAFATGSSMMPQKKNPDVAELVRGRSGGAVGALVSLLVTVKGLPLTYDRDLQEDKRPVFEATDSYLACLEVLCGLLSTLRFRPERMKAALDAGFLTATEVADYLVEKGVAFRDAHAVVGALVAEAESKGTTLAGLGLESLRKAHASFAADVMDRLDPERAVERRAHVGGPAKARVLEALAAAEARLGAR